MPMHKLSEGPITMTVTGIQEVEGKFGAQYKITGTGGTDVYVNVKSFDNQLKRLSLDPETIVGKTVRLYQVQKDGTTFTNMDLAPAGAATGVGAAPVTAARPSAPSVATAPKLTPQEAGALYAECLQQAVATLGVACEEAGIPVTADALQAAAATILIKTSR